MKRQHQNRKVTVQPLSASQAVALPADCFSFDADELGQQLLSRIAGPLPVNSLDAFDDEVADSECALDWVDDDTSVRAIERSLRHLVRRLAQPELSGIMPQAGGFLSMDKSRDRQQVPGLDITDPVSREVSLLDELDEAGEFASPSLRTQDSRMRGSARLARPRR